MHLVRTSCVFLTALLILVGFSPVEAAYVLKKGKLIDEKYVATMSGEEHLEAGKDAMEKEYWRLAQKHFMIVDVNFPHDDVSEEINYYIGISYFHLHDFDLANTYLSAYLEQPNHVRFFHEVLRHKFAIAEKFGQGYKKHMLGMEKMPQWVSAKDDGIKLYDEIIAVLPNHDLAARSLFAKADLLLEMESFRESNEAYVLLLRRFPDHEIAPKAYVALAELFLRQAKAQSRNPDLIDLARISMRKFSQAFPSDERLELANMKLLEMHEIYASELFATGQLYERKNKQRASVIYYSSVLLEYPDTAVAEKCKARLRELNNYASQVGINRELWQ
ncbi:MAG: outer membrane protein assembly factor BamD (BamD/ComL family) [Chlamydiales bacterium]|jgi:outer membrane protein assembly factor BamD (BamD/ComL family)